MVMLTQLLRMFDTVAGLLALVALVAWSVRAMRAMHVDPIVALRAE